MPTSIATPPTVTVWTELLRQGWTASGIKAQLSARRWRRWGYAIALHNGALTRPERWHVARLHAGPRALVTAFTALEACGLTGWEREEAWILARPGARVSGRSPVPLRVRRVNDWTQVRRLVEGPVQIPRQAALVAAAGCEAPRAACGLLAAVVQQRLVTPEALRAGLQGSPRLRHRAVLLATVDDIAQGAQALSEIDLARLCRRFRIPEPERQAVRRESGGRRRYLDAVWRRADGRLVVVEVDGALHLDQRRWWDDQLRQNEIVLGDAIVLRFPSAVVRTQPEVVARQLRRALAVPAVPPDKTTIGPPSPLDVLAVGGKGAPGTG